VYPATPTGKGKKKKNTGNHCQHCSRNHKKKTSTRYATWAVTVNRDALDDITSLRTEVFFFAGVAFAVSGCS
jgi:hypothetical protein